MTLCFVGPAKDFSGMVMPMIPIVSEDEMRSVADQCVKCGLCLPHCPTWMVHRREADSPRGRIELIAALAAGQMTFDPGVQARLDGCLLCRTCESVCPAQVPFGGLMDQARARWPTRRIIWPRLFCNSATRRPLRFVLWLAAFTGMTRAVRTLARTLATPGLLSDAIVLRRQPLARSGSLRIGLFVGCVSDGVDRATLNDAAVLLERCGARVEWLEGSGCCGALARHQGDLRRADGHVRGNAERIDLQALDAVISVATGCAAEFSDYPNFLTGSQGRAWAHRHSEVLAWLAGRQARLSFRPRRQTVLLHHPCSARGTLKDMISAGLLLHKVPDLRVVESGGPVCCGAAGVAMFREPRTARALANDIVGQCEHAGAEVLLTANVGCALHLRRALRLAGLEIPVVHPVHLLREQLLD